MGLLATYGTNNRLQRMEYGGWGMDSFYNGAGELARTVNIEQCSCSPCAGIVEYYHFLPDGKAMSLSSRQGVRVDYDYIWLDDLPIAQVTESYLTNGSHGTTGTTYLHADHLGTPRLGTNSQGLIVWKYQSDGFGVPTLTHPYLDNGVTIDVRLRLPGQLDYGGFHGVSYNYYRDYSPNLGRYLESDPVGIQSDINTYAYSWNVPTVAKDPLGLAPDIAPKAACSLVKQGYNPKDDECGCQKNVVTDLCMCYTKYSMFFQIGEQAVCVANAYRDKSKCIFDCASKSACTGPRNGAGANGSSVSTVSNGSPAPVQRSSLPRSPGPRFIRPLMHEM